MRPPPDVPAPPPAPAVLAPSREPAPAPLGCLPRRALVEARGSSSARVGFPVYGAGFLVQGLGCRLRVEIQG